MAGRRLINLLLAHFSCGIILKHVVLTKKIKKTLTQLLQNAFLAKKKKKWGAGGEDKIVRDKFTRGSFIGSG